MTKIAVATALFLLLSNCSCLNAQQPMAQSSDAPQIQSFDPSADPSLMMGTAMPYYFGDPQFGGSSDMPPYDDNMDMMMTRPMANKQCQPGQVFCFEQMACISLGKKKAGSARSRLLDGDGSDSPVKTCKPSEIYCLETESCRPRAKPSAIVGAKQGAQKSAGGLGVKIGVSGKPVPRRVKVTGTVTFQYNFDDVVGSTVRQEAFKQSFVQNLASRLMIPTSSIIVTGLRKGSIIVDFSVTQNSTVSNDDDATLIRSFQGNVALAIDDMQVDNGEGTVVTPSSYRITSSVEEDADEINNGSNGTTTMSIGDEIMSYIYATWIWIVVGVAAAIVVIVIIVIIVCCCAKKKREQNKVIPTSPPPGYYASYNNNNINVPPQQHQQMQLQQQHQFGEMEHQRNTIERVKTEMAPEDDDIFRASGTKAAPLHAEMAIGFKPIPASRAASGRSQMITPVAQAPNEIHHE